MPKAYQVANCESTLRQFDENGSPIVSHTRDYGLMQINEAVWDSTANRLGLDYKHSWRDNIKMAKIVYNKAASSFSPWVCKKAV